MCYAVKYPARNQPVILTTESPIFVSSPLASVAPQSRLPIVARRNSPIKRGWKCRFQNSSTVLIMAPIQGTRRCIRRIGISLRRVHGLLFMQMFSGHIVGQPTYVAGNNGISCLQANTTSCLINVNKPKYSGFEKSRQYGKNALKNKMKSSLLRVGGTIKFIIWRIRFRSITTGPMPTTFLGCHGFPRFFHPHDSVCLGQLDPILPTINTRKILWNGVRLKWPSSYFSTLETSKPSH